MWPEEIEAAVTGLSDRLGERPFAIDLVFPAGMPETEDLDELRRLVPRGHWDYVDELRKRYDVPALTQPSRRFPRTGPMTERQFEVALASPAPIMAIGLGFTAEVVRRIHDSDKIAIALVGSVRQAVRAAGAGFDMVVAQGADAAAHTGRVGTFSLVPAVQQVVPMTPVLAAGGISSGAQMAAALALGAGGFWVGTAWLLAPESSSSPILQQKLLAASTDDTVVTRSNTGKPQRHVRTKWSDEWEAPQAPPPLPMPLQDVLVGELLDQINEHQIEPLVHYPAGQGIGLLDQVLPVADRINQFESQLARALDDLSAYRQTRPTSGMSEAPPV
jgi:NAD(P)H-dependent flavin oxidoreductase YrpB (nitropropane dioxygenase family)